jgi:hypothetical protein
MVTVNKGPGTMAPEKASIKEDANKESNDIFPLSPKIK